MAGKVIAEDQTPDAKVVFLIPKDFILHACPDIKPIMLHQLLTPLTDTLSFLELEDALIV